MDATAFLACAQVAEELIASDTAAERWREPSALTGYTVGGLAGHLARAVLTLDGYLAGPAPQVEPTDAAGYYLRVLAAHDPVSSDFHLRVRQRGEEEAADGPAALAARLRDARDALADRLATVEAGRLVAALDGTALPVEEYLQTRLVELVVHLDDLAVSIGLAEPAGVPDAAYETVAVVLTRLAVRRTGGLPAVRSLARRERRPDAVRAL
jgi:hypothetical protein